HYVNGQSAVEAARTVLDSRKLHYYESEPAAASAL
ncbi:hypothetical protein CCACVL1_28263, partial [Corchorus capsularis]